MDDEGNWQTLETTQSAIKGFIVFEADGKLWACGCEVSASTVSSTTECTGRCEGLPIGESLPGLKVKPFFYQPDELTACIHDNRKQVVIMFKVPT